ncbi:serine/arginine repetitive matrix protein 1-like [Delphinapterus leucas]|uniref:Serine/arginine repetitive matrix protein 1-like n=1 Tax=Delphinapterus leucas TaxID=9749 RepID=A0A7F8KDM1_DELLE|nr:serine/arginine repetitive matrix protein 1-like [Delphinapterus leucas]
MNEGEQNSRGPEGGTPSVLRHSLSPLASHPPLYSASRGPRNAHLLRTTPKPPPPLFPPRRRRPLQNPPGRSARRRRRRASVAFPSPPPAPPPPANPELSVAQTSPPGPAGPARPSPHALRTLSNPLGSRLLLREETLAAAGAGAARLEAGRRRGAGYGEPSNGARAGAQRRRVLAEHGRGAAAAVAAGAQGPLHHWQPWSRSIFLPLGRRLGSAHVLGEEGAGARASPEGGGTCASADDASRSSPLPLQPVRPHPAAPVVRAGGGRRRRRRLLSRRRWWPEGLLQRLQPTPFKGTRASRVSVPRSPPPPRHESGFLLGAWRSPPPPRRTWARPRPARPSPPWRMSQRSEPQGPRKAGGSSG